MSAWQAAAAFSSIRAGSRRTPRRAACRDRAAGACRAGPTAGGVRFGRDVAGDTMVERARVGGVQHRGGGARRKPVEHDRHAPMRAARIARPSPRIRGRRAGAAHRTDRRPPPDAARRRPRRSRACARARRRRPRFRAGPVFRFAAEQREAERRRDGRVADPHLADRQRIDPRLDGHHPVGDRAGASSSLIAGPSTISPVGVSRFIS